MVKRICLNDRQIMDVMQMLSNNWERYTKDKVTVVNIAKELSESIGCNVIPSRVHKMIKSIGLKTYNSHKKITSKDVRLLASVLININKRNPELISDFDVEMLKTIEG